MIEVRGSGSADEPDPRSPANPETDGLLGRADAQYRPFVPFADWLRCAVDETGWATLARTLEEAKSAPNLAASLDVVKRAAAIDTGAIEGLYDTDLGFTLTVAARIGDWERQFSERSVETQRNIEDQIRAHDRLIDLVKAAQPLTEAAIRELHRVICQSQETYEARISVEGNTVIERRPLPKGEYKRLPNHVIKPGNEVLAFAPVGETSREMHRLVEQLHSAAFEAAHPVLQAAFAHYALVVIHPFTDGNGRVARLLASFFLWRGDAVPLLVFAGERAEYLAALRAADRGDLQGFVRFVESHGRSAMQLVVENLAIAQRPRFADILGRLRGLYHTRGRYGHQELDNAAQRLLRAHQDAFSRALHAVPKGTFATTELKDGHGAAFPTAERYRPVASGHGHYSYNVITPAPAMAQVHGRVQVEVPEDAAGSDRFLITWKSTMPEEPKVEVVYRMPVAEAMEGHSAARTVSIALSVDALLSRITEVLVRLAEEDRLKRGYK